MQSTLKKGRKLSELWKNCLRNASSIKQCFIRLQPGRKIISESMIKLCQVYTIIKDVYALFLLSLVKNKERQLINLCKESLFLHLLLVVSL